MEKLKGKCRTCYGCNLLDNEDFGGKEKCKNYVKDHTNLLKIIEIILYLLQIMMYIMIGLYLFYRFSILCGG